MCAQKKAIKFKIMVLTEVLNNPSLGTIRFEISGKDLIDFANTLIAGSKFQEQYN